MPRHFTRPGSEPLVIGDLVAEYCHRYGGLMSVAAEIGVHYSQLSQMQHGKLRPNAKVLRALGYRKVELYIPEEVPAPRVGYPYRQESA